MGNRRNYYRILRVQPDASGDVIRRSYRTLLQRLRLHPDLGGDHWSAALLNEAWAVLRGPEQRAAYDRELLRSHDLRSLSLGAFRHARRGGQRAGRGRRHLYRLLEVQPDAPQAVIEASWRLLRERPGADRAALDEAWEVLGDGVRREAYDRALRDGEPERGPGPARLALPAAGRAAPTGAPGPPRRGGYSAGHCPFCATPHAASASRWQPITCAGCASPLEPARRGTAGALGQRGTPRRAHPGRARVYPSWPGPALAATVGDLSPHGARLALAGLLGTAGIVKIDAEAFAAIARISHRRRLGQGCTIGVEFLTVRFARPSGTFVRERA